MMYTGFFRFTLCFPKIGDSCAVLWFLFIFVHSFLYGLLLLSGFLQKVCKKDRNLEFCFFSIIFINQETGSHTEYREAYRFLTTSPVYGFCIISNAVRAELTVPSPNAP